MRSKRTGWGFILPTVLFGIAITSLGLTLALQLLVTSWKLNEDYKKYVSKIKGRATNEFLSHILTESTAQHECKNGVCMFMAASETRVYPLRVDSAFENIPIAPCENETIPNSIETNGAVHPFSCDDNFQWNFSSIVAGNVISEFLTIRTYQHPIIIIEGQLHGALRLEGSGTTTIVAAGNIVLQHILSDEPAFVTLISATGSIKIHANSPSITLGLSAPGAIELPGGTKTQPALLPDLMRFNRLLLSR